MLKDSSLKNILLLLATALFILSLWYFSTIVFYILAAGVLSLIGRPVFLFFQKLRIKKIKFPSSACAILTLFVFYLSVVAVGALFAPLVIKEANLLSSIHYSQLSTNIQWNLNKINSLFNSLGFDENLINADFITDKAFEFINFTSLSNWVNAGVSIMGNFIAAVFSITFISFFFLSDQTLFFKILLLVFPSHIEPRVKGVLQKIIQLLSRYFNGLLIESAIITAIVSIALSIAGIKNSVLIGFFVGLVNIIPYVGPLMGLIFGLIVSTTTGINTSMFDFYSLTPIAIKTFCIIAGTQIFDNTIMQPYIFSKSVKAHPLEIFLVILIAGHLGGIAGMFMAVPFYTILRVVAKEFLNEFDVIKKFTHDI
jgi:predicted PurR-regulated permease PerM